MGDIKAKDLNTAGSVAAGDKILGSSINGTTANVTVETVGNYIIEQLTLISLGNTTSGKILNLESRIRNLKNIQTVGGNFTGSKTSEWEYTGYSLTIPNNHVYLVWGDLGWGESTPKGVALSLSNQYKWFSTLSESDSGIFVFNTAPLIKNSGTLYLWEKRNSPGTNIDRIQYIDLTL